MPATVAALDLFSSAPEPGRESAFVVLLAFLVSFLFIRTSARLMRSPRVPWWPGSVEAGGVHLHHMVWAVAFGIGAGLTLDEFALWLRLSDVYWSEQGRESIDAVIVCALIGGLVVVGVQPFNLDNTPSAIGTTVAVPIVVVLAAIAFAKGRLLLGAISIFIPVVGVVAAARLAKPSSPWAHRRYRGRRADKLERAKARYGPDRRGEVLGTRIRDAIGGTPDKSA